MVPLLGAATDLLLESEILTESIAVQTAHRRIQGPVCRRARSL
jgi:hypothetical protein